MSLQRLPPDAFETFTLVLHPSRRWRSGSLESPLFRGVTGSVRVFARGSAIEKEVDQVGSFLSRPFDEAALDKGIDAVKQIGRGTATGITGAMERYLAAVNAAPASSRRQEDVGVELWRPPVRLDRDFMAKRAVRSTLFPYYRVQHPSVQWAFTNYHSLNFFTASSVPSDSVLLYPNSASLGTGAIQSGTYALTGAFTFDFRINPRYAPRLVTEGFKAGTIVHLSSSYALSLVTGSLRDHDGRQLGYRLLLQLSHSAGLQPSLALPGTFAQGRDLVFLSDDNSLRRNHWHHVTVAWGTSTHDAGTGSFVVDGDLRGTFVVPSSSIALSGTAANPDVLCVGNFYEGNNAGNNSMALWFSTDAQRREGLTRLIGTPAGTDQPASFRFDHPLNAEVHDLKVYARRLHSAELAGLSGSGPKDLGGGLRFYLPPFFCRESPTRNFVGTTGGVLQTPFFSASGSSDDPVNSALSFGVGGHDVNLENWVRDFATGFYPRLLNLTASVFNATSEAKTANELMYATGTVRKRNLTLLPCDDGRFVPRFDLLLSGPLSGRPDVGTPMDHFVDDLGTLDLSLVTLVAAASTASIRPGLTEEGTGRGILSATVGPTPEDPGIAPGSVLAVLQRTRDTSSNEVTLLSLSDLLYGGEIDPGTVTLRDGALTGSGARVGITLRDDGWGNLYRADADTPHATWASVGNVLYQEGILVVKDPVLPFFGKDQVELSFSGTQEIHVLRARVVAQAGTLTSSSNPSFLPLSATLDANDNDPRFVYVDTINFHDDNLNVVMRAKLAQPIVKRHGQRVAFNIRMDF